MRTVLSVSLPENIAKELDFRYDGNIEVVFKELVYSFLSVDGYMVGKVVNKNICINQIHL